ncbi:hypothetical protein [Haloferax sp. DFSO60]|uniref:hypothetical protein n=1 Tax=Haloferax sp. DFSO60 TaxID=3388652 RepID=UPI00397853FD
MPSASAQTTLTATDETVVSHNGQLTSITVAPSGTVSYEGLEQTAANVTVTVEASLDGTSWSHVASKQVDASGLNGTVSYAFKPRSLLSGKDSFSKSAFRSKADGSSETTDVHIRVRSVVYESSGKNVSTQSSTVFTVAVQNVPRGSGVGGKVNGNAN